MIHYILHQANYWEIFGFTIIGFLLMYFVVGGIFLKVCHILNNHGWLNIITKGEVKPKQIKFEIGHSLKSIFIFGISGIPLIALYRLGYISFGPDTIGNIIFGLLVLNLYNEAHFFLIHRIMHLPFFMKNVHWVHHKTRIPTVYSVYSFHWFEATLLSTVPLSITPFFEFSAVAVALYPLTSILINFAGHCNYRFGNGDGWSWQIFGTAHNQHHSKGRQNFGFLLPIFDQILNKLKANDRSK